MAANQGSTHAECNLNLNSAQDAPSAPARPSLGAPVGDDPGCGLRRHLHQSQHHRPPVGFGLPLSEEGSRQRMADIILTLTPNLPSAKK